MPKKYWNPFIIIKIINIATAIIPRYLRSDEPEEPDDEPEEPEELKKVDMPEEEPEELEEELESPKEKNIVI